MRSDQTNGFSPNEGSGLYRQCCGSASFYADPDQTLYTDADPDPDPEWHQNNADHMRIADPTPSVTHWHALDADPDPDPAKLCGSDPILIHNTGCRENLSMVA